MESKKNTFYVDNFESSKKLIDDISPTFCAAKWLQVSLHLTNGKTHSCYHPPTHSIDVGQLEDNPAALHNTTQKFQERNLMLNGQRPSGCDYCWKIEDAGHVSDRYYRSSEHWAKHKIFEIAKQPFDFNVVPTYVEVNFNQTCNFKCAYCSPHLSSEWENEIKQFGPYQVDGKAHNDTIMLKNIGLMPIEGSNKNNPYVQAFWRWWPEIYKDLEVFRMTGGEPLMDSNTFKVLEYVVNNPNKNLELSITSNMCPPKDLFEKFINSVKLLDSVEYSVECYVPDPKNNTEWTEWEHYIIGEENKRYHNSNLNFIERKDIPEIFNEEGRTKSNGSFTYLYKYQDYACKHFVLYISLDSLGDQAEYIRNGLDFEILKNNLEKFLMETENTSITFINTFNILSIPRFKQYLEMILKLRGKYSGTAQMLKDKKPFQRIWFDIPVLQKPEWLSVLNCTDDHVNELENILEWMATHTSEDYSKTLQGFKIYELEKLKRNIDLIKNNRYSVETTIKNKTNFKEFFQEHDARRNTNFLNTFPEFEVWYRNP